MGRKRKGSTENPDDIQQPKESIDTEDARGSAEGSQQKFQKRFPHLAAELVTTRSSVSIDGVRWEETDRTQVTPTSDRARFTGFSPDVIDFIRRCNTEQEALEIITYLEKRGEIDNSYAKTLRHQLKTRGLRSFGSKKSWGHYEREG